MLRLAAEDQLLRLYLQTVFDCLIKRRARSWVVCSISARMHHGDARRRRREHEARYIEHTPALRTTTSPHNLTRSIESSFHNELQSNTRSAGRHRRPRRLLRSLRADCLAHTSVGNLLAHSSFGSKRASRFCDEEKSCRGQAR